MNLVFIKLYILIFMLYECQIINCDDIKNIGDNNNNNNANKDNVQQVAINTISSDNNIKNNENNTLTLLSNIQEKATSNANNENEKQRIHSRKGVQFDALSKNSKSSEEKDESEISSSLPKTSSLSNLTDNNKIIDITKGVNENNLKEMASTITSSESENSAQKSTIEKSNIISTTTKMSNETNLINATLQLTSASPPPSPKSSIGNDISTISRVNNSSTINGSSTTAITNTTTTKTTTLPTTTTTEIPKKPTLTFSVEDDPTILQVDRSKDIPSANKDTINETHENLTDDTSEELIIDGGRRQYLIPMVAFVFAIPMILGIGTVVWRRVKDYWTTRYYRRMDFLVDGMYCD